MEYGTEVDIDRRKCTRQVPMKVLALGCGRTGTNSLCTALRMLGYNETYHMSKCSGAHPRDCEMWLDAFRAKYDGVGTFGREDWDRLLGHCMAVTDYPAACFAPELIEAYPDAKVILSNRDVDAWFESTKSTINWRANDRGLYWLSFVDWGYRMYAPMFYKMWNGFFDGDFEKNGKAVFTKHYQEVRDLVPADRLLEYNVKMGWEPLCTFLKVDVPDKPFPSGNHQESFHQSCREKDLIKAGRFGTRLGIGLALMSILAGIVWKRVR